MAADLHNYEQRLKSTYQNIQSSDKIREENNYLEGVEVETTVDKDIEAKTKKLRKNIIEDQVGLKDDKINEKAKEIVAEEFANIEIQN